jgi:hypothetical protein
MVKTWYKVNLVTSTLQSKWWEKFSRENCFLIHPGTGLSYYCIIKVVTSVNCFRIIKYTLLVWELLWTKIVLQYYHTIFFMSCTAGPLLQRRLDLRGPGDRWRQVRVRVDASREVLLGAELRVLWALHNRALQRRLPLHPQQVLIYIACTAVWTKSTWSYCRFE